MRTRNVPDRGRHPQPFGGDANRRRIRRLALCQCHWAQRRRRRARRRPALRRCSGPARSASSCEWAFIGRRAPLRRDNQIGRFLAALTHRRRGRDRRSLGPGSPRGSATDDLERDDARAIETVVRRGDRDLVRAVDGGGEDRAATLVACYVGAIGIDDGVEPDARHFRRA